MLSLTIRCRKVRLLLFSEMIRSRRCYRLVIRRRLTVLVLYVLRVIRRHRISTVTRPLIFFGRSLSWGILLIATILRFTCLMTILGRLLVAFLNFAAHVLITSSGVLALVGVLSYFSASPLVRLRCLRALCTLMSRLRVRILVMIVFLTRLIRMAPRLCKNLRRAIIVLARVLVTGLTRPVLRAKVAVALVVL